MTAQLQLDVGVRLATAIEALLLVDLDHLRREPPDPADVANHQAYGRLVQGIELQLDWLARTDPLPDEPLAWPCSACFAAPGEPCDLPDREDKWTGPPPHYHLCRGTTGRWSSVRPERRPIR